MKGEKTYRQTAWSALLLIVSACTGLLSCRKNEVPAPPLIFGISLEKEISADDIRLSLLASDSCNPNNPEFSIEIPLLPDSAGVFLYPSPEALAALRTFSNDSNNKNISLAFVTRQREIVFEGDSLKDATVFFEKLREAGDTCAAMLRNDHSRLRFLWGEDWMPAENWPAYWEKLLSHFKNQHITSSYFFSVQRLGRCALWKLSDEIAVSIPPTLKGGDKQFHTEWHERACSLASETGKKIFIARANLITPHAAEDFPHLFLYWDKSCEISGICLNTLSPRICILDDSPYYGRKNDPDFLQKLTSRMQKHP